MDPTIEELLLNYKRASDLAEEPDPAERPNLTEELSPAERERFADVSYGTITRQLYSRLPGEMPQIESIDPEDGTVIYWDSYGRSILPLKTFGYQPKGDEGEFKFSVKQR